MIPQTILILDFGAQYTQLIARRVREHHVHSLIVRPGISVDEIRKHGTVGLIFSGGPSSVYDDSAPKCGHLLRHATRVLSTRWRRQEQQVPRVRQDAIANHQG